MRLTRSPEPQSQEIHPSGFPALWMSARSRLWIRSGPPISPPSRCRRDSSTWWRSWICSPEMSNPSEKPTATRSSVSMPWRWHWQRKIKISWSGRKAARTTSWSNGCGAQSSTRRCTCTPKAMVGTLRSTWPASSGGPAMEGHTALWAAELPTRSTLRLHSVPPAQG